MQRCRGCKKPMDAALLVKKRCPECVILRAERRAAGVPMKVHPPLTTGPCRRCGKDVTNIRVYKYCPGCRTIKALTKETKQLGRLEKQLEDAAYRERVEEAQRLAKKYPS